MSIEMKDRGDALENEYFQRKEKELIAKMKAKIASESSADSAVKCPKCDGNLIESDFESIKIDVCNNCSGVWLDAGELTQIADRDEESGWFGKLFK